ncbi:MAG: 1-acyl-sn-glycerol-3-phosphate acyltransferase [Acidimicrobiia bacterium]|nr:1-acyl-sn-glycerol-3-phosphate acyltransferase [Acidimicrobiia bacterium]
MRTLKALPRTILTLLSGLVATLIYAPLAWIVGHRDPSSRTVDKIVRSWAQVWLRAGGVRMIVTGADKVDTSVSHVVVANHLSNFDIMVCFAAIPLPIRYLAKKELFKIPILAPAMRAIGIVEVDRQARSAALASINEQSARVIERGHSLIIYPEGTRSRSSDIAPFKKGAFTMAVTAGMPVLPVTIHGAWEAWKPESLMVYGGTVHVVFDEAIPTVGLGRSDVDGLRDRAFALIDGNYTRLRTEVQS